MATSSAFAQQPTQVWQAEPVENENRQVAVQCLDDVRTFQLELQGTAFGMWDPAWGAAPPERAVGVGAWGPGAWGAGWGMGAWGLGGPMQQEMRDLMQAARFMAATGDEAGCQAVLEQMRARHGEWIEVARIDPAEPMAWRRPMLAAAIPVEEVERAVRADRIRGTEVRNLHDEHLGAIEDVVLDPRDHTIRYVTIARGGFLGIGDEYIPVRWEDLRVTPDWMTFVLDVPEEAIETAPSTGDPGFFAVAGDDWWQQVEQYWDRVLPG